MSHRIDVVLEGHGTPVGSTRSNLDNHLFILDQYNTCSPNPDPNPDSAQRAQRLRSRSSQRKVVGVVIFHILRHPKNDGATDSQSIQHKPKHLDVLPEHDQPIRDNVRDAEIQCRKRIIGDNVFQHQNSLQHIVSLLSSTFPNPVSSLKPLPIPINEPHPPSLPPPCPQRRSSTHHTPRQPPRHKRKSQKQDQPRLPSHPRPTVRIGIRAQPCLLDRVDDQHAESRAYPGDPVHELDVDEASISEGGAVGGGVDEEEESEGELL